jgi:hypothetical protein
MMTKFKPTCVLVHDREDLEKGRTVLVNICPIST